MRCRSTMPQPVQTSTRAHTHSKESCASSIPLHPKQHWQDQPHTMRIQHIDDLSTLTKGNADQSGAAEGLRPHLYGRGLCHPMPAGRPASPANPCQALQQSTMEAQSLGCRPLPSLKRTVHEAAAVGRAAWGLPPCADQLALQ